MAELALPPGVIRGSNPTATPQGRYYDTNLVRWQDGQLRPMGGWVRLTGSPLPTIARHLNAWLDNSAQRRVAIMCDTKIYLLDSSTFTSVEPLDFVGYAPSSGGGYGDGNYGAETYGDARSVATIISGRPPWWGTDTWGQDIVFLASTDGRLLNWSPTTPGSRAAAISGAPLSNRCFVVTPERHILVGGIAGNPREIGWCSREDRTDWNFASTTNTAGKLPIDCKGAISALYAVREGSLMMTDDEVWIVRYVGAPFIFGADRLSDTADILGFRTVAQFNGKAAWMGKNGFWLYEGAAPVPLPSDVGGYVFHDINRDAAPFVAVGSVNGTFKEVMWFYPSAASAVNDRYVVWNYAEKWWALGQLPRAAMLDAGVYPYPMMAGNDGHLYQHETGFTDAGLPRIGNVYAETGPYKLGDGARCMKASMAQMDGGSAYDALQLEAYVRRTLQGPETLKGPYVPKASGYLPLRMEGRTIRFRIEARRDEDFGLGSVIMDLQPGAAR